MKTTHGRAARRTALAAAVLVAAGCASTRVTNSWTASDINAQERPKRALVLALFPNEVTRRSLEENLSTQLAEHGVEAVPALRYVADTRSLEQKDLQQLARQQGFDSVVISRFVGIQYEPELYPGYVGFAPYYGPLGGGWSAPGYIYPEPEALVETSLFDATSGGKLLWSALSETVNPDASAGQMNAIATKVVDRMEKDAVL